MARTGMSGLMTRLRGMTDAGTADYTVSGGETFWTDGQLELILDRQREAHERDRLIACRDSEGGSAVYTRYLWGVPDVERAESGPAAWRVEDSRGSAVGTADYTVNYDAAELTFDSDTGGTAYYLTYRSYDMQRAAAEVWETKAAHVAARYDVATDNHKLERSQLRAACMDMAAAMRRQAKPRAVRLIREDVY